MIQAIMAVMAQFMEEPREQAIPHFLTQEIEPLTSMVLMITLIVELIAFSI
jgi:hypothetical protein